MRETKEIILQQKGQNLTFVIEQMPATKLQIWLMKALTCLLGTEISELDFGALQKEINIKGLSFLQNLDIDKIEPLINTLYSCVKYKVDGTLMQIDQNNIDSIILDVRTLFSLQKEVLKHNLSFFGESPLNINEGVKQTVNTFNMPMFQTK